MSLLRPQRPYVDAARARDRRNPGHHRGLSPGRRERQGRRLRRRRDPRRQRLSARPVPAGRLEPAHRRLRRLDREPRPADARSDRRRRLRLGRGPGRHASRAARRRARHGRQRSCRRPSAMSRANSAGGRSPSSAPARRSRTPRLGPTLKAAFGGVYVANERFDEASGRGGARRRARPTRWPSASCSSPTPICRAASRSARRSTRGTAETFYATVPVGYTDYPALSEAAE